MFKRILPAAVVTAIFLVAAGCGGSSPKPSSTGAKDVSPAGDIPDNQAYVAYAPAGGRYRVSVPEGWSRTTAGRAVTFTDKLNTIRMESLTAGAPPSVAAARRDDLPKLARTVRGFKPETVTTVRRKAGTAVKVTYLAAGPANAVTGKAQVDAVERYAFFRNGKEVVLTLSGPRGADNVDPWRTVTDSLRWT